VIDAAERGAAAADLRDPVVGPVDYSALSYPYVEILPESTDDQGGNEWAHTLRANLYFERGRRTDYVDDVLPAVRDIVTGIIEELGTVECVVSYRPTTVEDFAGELDGTLVLLVSAQFTVSTLVDVGAQ
jgi:hypothetical protein